MYYFLDERLKDFEETKGKKLDQDQKAKDEFWKIQAENFVKFNPASPRYEVYTRPPPFSKRYPEVEDIAQEIKEEIELEFCTFVESMGSSELNMRTWIR